MLHYHFEGQGAPFLLLHGLFGHLDNLAVLGRELQKKYNIIRVDLRNHGLSPRAHIMDYPMMAQDIIELCDALHLNKISLIGHSMGGKIAMQLSQLIPDRIENLIVLDIAPVRYDIDKYNYNCIFMAFEMIKEKGVTTRQDITQIMRIFISEENIIQFLLKSYQQGNWLFNIEGLHNSITNIADWHLLPAYNKPVLFIKGEKSDYIIPAYQKAILKQFPNAKVHIVANAGHNVHAEQPENVIRAINRFIQ